jgi:hypothetical protein
LIASSRLHRVVTTRWANLGGRRLDVPDVIALNLANGAMRQTE